MSYTFPEVLNRLIDYSMFKYLLLTGSEERDVLGFGKVPVAMLPSCQYI